MKKLILILLFSIVFIACDKKIDQRIIKQSVSMGTFIEIQIISDNKQKADSIINEAFIEIERINQKYSTYKKNNYIFKLNSNSDTFAVDKETYFLLQKCEEMFQKTSGRFDAAIGNLIKLIGFESDNPHLPPKNDIDSVIQQTGWKHINISHKDTLIRDRKVRINFGGIAKGYAVDRASAIISEAGFNTYLVNAGGEIQAKGKVWNIAIQHPRIENEKLGILQLENVAVASSGDYEQFFQKDGKRFSHIIDPTSGQPCDYCEAVTIITHNDIDADGLATGIFVLGDKLGMKLIDSLENVEGIIVNKQGELLFSKGMNKYYRKY